MKWILDRTKWPTISVPDSNDPEIIQVRGTRREITSTMIKDAKRIWIDNHRGTLRS